jgi:sugar phosphate isomerase/epimerase
MTAIAGIDVGCSTNLLNNPADIVHCVEMLPRELETIEIEIEEDARAALLRTNAIGRQQLAAALLKLAEKQGRRYVIHAPWYGGGLSLCCPTSGFREIARVALLLALDFAERVASPIVTFHPGLHEEQDEESLVDNLLENLEPVVDVATEAGIVLCMETMSGLGTRNAVLSASAHRRLWEVLGIRACLDIPHAVSRVSTLAELEQYLDDMQPFIGHVHLADTRLGVHRHLPIGAGELDLARLLRRLAAGGYQGSAVVEEWNRGHSPDLYLASAVRFAAEHAE